QPSAALNASAMAGPSTHAAAPTAIAMAATMMPYSTAVAPRSSYARISCSRAHNLIMEGPPDGWYLPSLTSPHGRKYGRTAAATDTAVGWGAWPVGCLDGKTGPSVDMSPTRWTRSAAVVG